MGAESGMRAEDNKWLLRGGVVVICKTEEKKSIERAIY